MRFVLAVIGGLKEEGRGGKIGPIGELAHCGVGDFGIVVSDGFANNGERRIAADARQDADEGDARGLGVGALQRRQNYFAGFFVFR